MLKEFELALKLSEPIESLGFDSHVVSAFKFAKCERIYKVYQYHINNYSEYRGAESSNSGIRKMRGIGRKFFSYVNNVLLDNGLPSLDDAVKIVNGEIESRYNDWVTECASSGVSDDVDSNGYVCLNGGVSFTSKCIVCGEETPIDSHQTSVMCDKCKEAIMKMRGVSI